MMDSRRASSLEDRKKAFVGWARLKYVAKVGAVKGVGLGREVEAEDKGR
jgi:hypothetical protein